MNLTCNLAGRCLLEAAQNLTQTPALFFQRTILSCVEECVQAKRAANRRERYVSSLHGYLRQFIAGRENQPLAAFTFREIEQWLARYSNAATRQTWLVRLSALFSFCVRRGYIASNPCDRVERVMVDRKPPLVLTPEQARLLLKSCPTVCKPYLVLALFAGIRPEEILRMDWSQIDLASATARVDGKTRRRRIVPLEPVAVKLLSAHPLKSGAVAPSHSTIRRFLHRARAVLGFEKWPQDVLRHTAASYLLAKYQDAGKVALWLGNSAKILLTHYHDPVKAESAAEFWRV